MRIILSLMGAAAMALALGLPASAAGASEADVKAAVQAIYARIADSGSTVPPNGPLVYTAATWAKIEAANAKTPEGEMGPIEAEPLCNCQDTTGMKAEVTGVILLEDEADASISLVWPDNSAGGVTLHMKKEAGAWKVEDASPDGDPGLLYMLEEAGKPQ